MILIINTSFVKTKLRRRNEDGVGLYPAWADQARIPRSHLTLKIKKAARYNNQSINLNGITALCDNLILL